MTLFVGAGVSVESGAPDFKRLRDIFLRPLVGPGACAEIGVDQFAPELLFQALDDGREETRERVRRTMWQECEPHRPGPNHHAIARLGAAGARVWTTNFDTLIERAASIDGIPCRVIAATASPAGAVARPGELLLLKPHGSFPQSGDPPREPRVHDYPLLFRSTDVWRELGGTWLERLREDCAGRDVRLFGYRGADLDVVPALLRGLPGATRVEWWEFDDAAGHGRANAAQLQARFGPATMVRLGAPSQALQQLSAGSDSRPLPPLVAPPDPGPLPVSPLVATWSLKAVADGQFRGSAHARRAYARALLSDPWVLRPRALSRLLRSAGYDLRPVGAAELALLRVALRLPRVRDAFEPWRMYATLLDAQPQRPGDERDLARLRGSRHAGSADLLVRLSSKLKRDGQLTAAAADAQSALDELRRRERPQPLLEAMAAYNLAWIERQRWQPARRREVVAAYGERMPHIGFNWAAWLHLDDTLLALCEGRVADARERLSDPFVRFARERIAHPSYLADEQLANVLLDWHEHGPGGVAGRLEQVLRFDGTVGRRAPSFNAVDTLVLLAEHARVVGDRSRCERLLGDAARRTRSRLQLRRITLVGAAAADDAAALDALAHDPEAGLVAATASALSGGSGRGLAVTAAAPLPALY
ncbi:SIR2 family protein [Conexibacter sp. JD483]|uniref:SIR2 family protein n=1 Tax=unclassified Conexibacter TaxID=2627773 RepID=UPI00271895A6|nr:MULTISPECIES: SIR2 family protein [unclassified Conexibacter]MDO8185538.1 SIR2 family protein [Conexibacter sp. CPCC 205706]MDO8197275.1 SIR2 family protein [Conexibacter sp. CPCC 205762]MDR9370771.1 SIR2 family protein [Conexibacter sp. JD483]